MMITRFSKILCFSLLIVLLYGCQSKRTGKRPKNQVVPIAINIKGNSYQLGSVSLEMYRFKLYQELGQFQHVDLDLVGADENPAITLDLTIDNFLIWPKDERTSRRVFSRTVAVGTNAQGKPIYQVVSASVDFTQTIIKSNARLVTKMTIKGEPPFVFQRTFVPNYTYTNVSVGNVSGDPRAVDPSIMAVGSMPIEPTADEFLLALSHREMIRRLSDELRKRYR